MNYISELQLDLNRGYSKSDLERLIGLPKNNLSGILKGDRKLSKKSMIKIDKWMKSDKPDPLEVRFESTAKKIKVSDIRKEFTPNKESESLPIPENKKDGNLKDLTIKVDHVEMKFASDMERELWVMEQKYLKPKK